MSKDPAFLFYSQDFLAGTLIMPFEDRGKYITLLCFQHQNGRMSEETIRLLVGLFSDTLRLKFQQDKSGLFYNERLEFEVSKRLNFVESRINNGKLGGRPKKPKHNLHEDVNENENEIYFLLLKKVIKENEVLLPEGFEPLILEWLKYKSEKRQSYKETGLKTFIKTFLKDSNSDIKIGRSMLDYSMSKNYDGLYLPKPEKNAPKQEERKFTPQTKW